VNPLTLSRKESAEVLGVSVWVLDRYIADGLLPIVILPSTKYSGERNRRVLIAVGDLEAFIAKHRTPVRSKGTE
jgi:hypothetical protein